jgi:hypothetical protein
MMAVAKRGLGLLNIQKVCYIKFFRAQLMKKYYEYENGLVQPDRQQI